MDAGELVDHVEEVALAEGLAEKIVGAGVDGVLAILGEGAGGEGDDARVGSAGQGADLANGLAAVHVRHAEVHQDEAGMPGLEGGDGLGARGGGFGFEADRLEEADEEFAIFGHVIVDKDAKAGLAGSDLVHAFAEDHGVAFDGGGGARLDADGDSEFGAAADLAGDGDVATHEAGEFAADGKAEAGAAEAMAGAGLGEGLEEAVLIVFADAGAGVADFDAEDGAAQFGSGGDNDASALGEFNGVADEVDDDLTQFAFVGGGEAGDTGIDVHFELKIFGLHAEAEHAFDVGEEAMQIEGD